MIVKIITVFRDKFTHQLYNIGELIEIADEARVQDLEERKLAERLEEVKNSEDKKEVKISLFELEFDKKALVDALKAIGEKATMNMKEETLLANVAALGEDKAAVLKEVLGIEA
ncbi:MAG: hypothetical protein EGQ20_19960 [Bacteroides oleiciplenus]|jgi:hypothetical protein|nr:hypothetical protein [Bacteroides oleiciplenus]